MLYGGIITLILLVFSGGVYIYFENSLQRSIDAKIRSMGEVISSSMTDTHDPTLFGNFERYLENVLGRKPKGKLVQIMDSSGRIGAKSSDIEARELLGKLRHPGAGLCRGGSLRDRGKGATQTPPGHDPHNGQQEGDEHRAGRDIA